MLIDTHCHLHLPAFANKLGHYLADASASGVRRWIATSVTPQDWANLTEAANRYPSICPAYGIHPAYAGQSTQVDLKILEQLAQQSVAIGETGLDRNLPDLGKQEALFRAQLRIARRHNLPVQIHCYRMIEKTIQILKEEGAGKLKGIMHAFSGSLESAQQCIKLGFLISIGSALLQPEAIRYHALATKLPLEYLVLETDAPAPGDHPRNQPACLHEIAATVAKLRGVSISEIIEQTGNTAATVIPGLASQACSIPNHVLESC